MIPLFSQQYTKTCRTPAHWWTFNTACSLKATSCRLSDPLRGHLSTWQEILPEGAVVKVSKPSQDTPKGNTNRLGRSLLLSNDCAPKGGAEGTYGTPSQTEHPLVDPQKLGTVRKILHAKIPSTRLDLAYKLSTMGTYSLPDAPQVPTVGTYGTVDPNFVRGIEGPDCRDGAMNPWQTPEIVSVTIRSSVTNSQEKGGLTSSILARGYGKTTSNPSSESSKKMNVPRGDTRLAFHQQVKQALQIISSQSVFETNYRISRPSLGIRAGKLASYQVTLRGNKIHSFLSRFSELWSSQSKLLDTGGTYGMGGSTISPQSFEKVPMAGDSRGGIPSVTPNISIPGVKNSSSPYLNDGSKLQSFEDQSLPFWFDKTGNFHCGLSTFFLFPEIERNSKLHLLGSCGCSVTIHTNAQTNSRTKTLLSKWGIFFK